MVVYLVLQYNKTKVAVVKYNIFNHLYRLIKIVSYIIILLGIIHVSFAFPLHMNVDTLWFVGAGMAIIFAGLLNLIANERSSSKIAKPIAIVVNALTCALFCFALVILNEPQVYIGIILFLIATGAFILQLTSLKSLKP